MHLVRSSQDCEHHLYVNWGSFKASDLNDSNALVAVHSKSTIEMVETNENNPTEWLAGHLASKTSWQILASSGLEDERLKTHRLSASTYVEALKPDHSINRKSK